jgi:pimeloyl-ACP methyl ester carboxylesterase
MFNWLVNYFRKCPRCGAHNKPLDDQDLITCTGKNGACKTRYPSGFEDRIREWQEREHTPIGKIPRRAVARAICYASDIYALSTHGTTIDCDAIEKQVSQALHPGAHTVPKATLVKTIKRKCNGVEDNGVGVGIFIVSATESHQVSHGIRSTGPVSRATHNYTTNSQPWGLIYVVFRGSRGDNPGSAVNPLGAGWGRDKDPNSQMVMNLDWQANLNNQMTVPPWHAGVRIHAGFCALYRSVVDEIESTITQQRANLVALRKDNGARLGIDNPQVIICGHSLGAGLATVCAHDLECRGICDPFCFAFCSPRVGDLAFARDFNQRISERRSFYPLADEGNGSRGFLFVQRNDPISRGQEHAFASTVFANKRAELNAAANSGSIATQGIFTLRQSSSAADIYYHVQNKITVSWFGLHDFNAMKASLLQW